VAVAARSRAWPWIRFVSVPVVVTKWVTRTGLRANVNSRPAIIFDLDGTLVDSRSAIVASLHHAQRQCGFEIDADDDLRWALGPPLRDIMKRLLRTDDAASIAGGIAAYREHHPSVCLTHAQCYPGIHEALTELAATLTLFVGTSKLESVALSVIDHFRLRQMFQRVCGSQPDGRLTQKVDVINHLVRSAGLDASNVIVVGDRASDVCAAKACGVRAIAVTYGYGSLDELRSANPSTFCQAPHDLPAIMRSLSV
jgi:phosphoglycolate phosphatase